MTEAKPIRALPRILDKISRQEAFSVSKIVGAKDHRGLELHGALFVTPQRQFTPPVQIAPEEKATRAVGAGWPHPTFLEGHYCFEQSSLLRETSTSLFPFPLFSFIYLYSFYLLLSFHIFFSLCF